MLTDFNKNCKTTMIKNKIIIDNDFPSYKLIQVMRPYLLLFITSKYSLLSYKRIDSANFLRYLLLRFNSYNPQFGRKKYKIVIKYNNNFEKKIVGRITEFDEKHIKFNNTEKQNECFLKDHLDFVETYYDNNNFIIMNEDGDLINNNNNNNEIIYNDSDQYLTSDNNEDQTENEDLTNYNQFTEENYETEQEDYDLDSIS
jgi:hypothetical protein